ncbi:glycosyltransferase [Allorhizobium sp. BGMRC 0089]|uniref:glycosyltransferase family 2 protein n=1 Tax=Allorhizobium sonneratiae TaxID=2934936 RepID=UPI002033F486|nr:glycosyltransferase [Allorhizobium sonneratiae]MCM2293734.1 glycosyltransferase [Allorhizobium sonneratiae]
MAVSMPLLSLSMPSNKPLEKSRAAIESALAFCEARDALLIVADSADDPEKQRFCQSVSPRLRYLASREKRALFNFNCAIQAAETDFIMPMADDDLIFADAGEPSVDLACLPAGVAGLFPVREEVGENDSVSATRTFSLPGADPAERMRTYLSEAGGRNSAFYSIFRRRTLQGIMRLLTAFHPNGGAYTDWSVVLCQLACGPVLFDGSIRYRYRLGNWADAQTSAASLAGLYREAGLPEASPLWMRLLTYLDLFVLVSSPVVALGEDDKAQLTARLSSGLLLDFTSRVADDPAGFDDHALALCTMITEEADSFTRFQLSLMLVDRLQPGLKDRYVAFFRAALAN